MAESSSRINLFIMFTVICFIVVMISINGYMSAMNLIAQLEADNIAHYALASGLNAVGQMIAMCIIIYFGLNNSVDNTAPAILRGMFCVYLNIHNAIIKLWSILAIW
jgi:hypothetical protein